MLPFFRSVLLASAVVAVGYSVAQPASGPMSGMGPRAGAGMTPGWQMMTPEERAAHQKAMADMKSHDECVAYRDKHHAEMAARMKEHGQAMPDMPRRDVCLGLK